MANKNYKKSKTRKTLIALLAATAITCTGLAAACSPSGDEEESALAAKKEDTQLLKNGNFEFFDYPSESYIKDGKSVFLIKSVDSWSRGGDSSNAMSGIIGTSSSQWAELTASDLKDKLEFNADLTSDDEDRVNYNGMLARDILYKDTYAALLADGDVKDSYIKNQSYENYFGIKERGGKYYIGTTEVFKKTPAEGEEADIEYYLDAECTKTVRSQLISNPGTHFGDFNEKDGKYFYGDKEVFAGDYDGYYYKDGDEDVYVSNVLMVHNYSSGSYNGISQYYSSQTITLEANTAAEISVWVKTSDLKFDKGFSQLEDQDRGAFIEVVQTVAGSSIDSFKIKAINTEKIINDSVENNYAITNESNGWLNYTIFVKACDFGDSTVQLNLGLGGSEAYEKCTGYAFFDDVQVTKYIDLEDETEGSASYKANSGKISDDTTYTLTGEKKEFIADKELRGTVTSDKSYRNSRDYYYCIDLASSTGTGYKTLDLGGKVTAGLTYEKTNGKNYASATKISNDAVINGVAVDSATYELPKTLKNGIDTQYDLLGVYGANGITDGGYKYAKKLNDALTGENSFTTLPDYDGSGNMLVMLSAYGAAYTSIVKDNSFTVEKDGGYKIISFWVKTSDMKGNTAATLKLVPLDKDDARDEDNAQQLTVDTTGVTTNVGAKDDLYNGWVQCFFFIENETEEDKNFEIDFCFGINELASATVTSFKYGWVALANLQTLDINEDIYGLASSGSYTLKYSFSDEDKDESGTPFAEASSTSDIKNGFANASNYDGVNGGSSYVSDNDYRLEYDAKNPKNKTAGLINRDDTDGAFLDSIYTSFGKAGADWNGVFGENCYQPLIIVNNIREYTEKQGDNEETLKVVNYGFIGSSKTVTSNSYETVSTKVLVTGDAEAYIYLVDSNTREVLKYSTPNFSFWYDDEGNVLNKAYDEDMSEDEHRAAIVYTLRDDGLYEDKDGKLFANTHNLIRSYKYYKYESNTFYDATGKQVSFDDLVDGETYYSDKEHTKESDHFLVNSDGKRVYEYANGEFYYLVDGARADKITPFATEYAKPAAPDFPAYAVKVTADDCTDISGNLHWVTVNFLIHTGSESLNYRLELWSGARGETGVDANDNYKNGAIAFDYSAYSLSESSYASVLGKYEKDIINAYKAVLKDNGKLDQVASNEENIAYFENLIKELGLTEQAKAAVKAYTAYYHTFSLYDSAAYVPFNANTAEDGETGYDYKASGFEETLAYFEFVNENENSINVFADYSAVNQNIPMGTANDSDKEEDEENTNSGEVWLLVSAIVLVIALLFTLASLLLRDALKKRRVKNGNKNLKKNNYRQRQRYIRKLHLVENADEQASDGETAENAENTENAAEEPVENNEKPAENEVETDENTQDFTEPAQENADENGNEPQE